MESKVYYKNRHIGENRLIVLMMKLEADLCVMTTPDLENFQLKRSYVKKDIEYIYVPHDVNSVNLAFRKEALDHFDTIFASGIHNMYAILRIGLMLCVRNMRQMVFSFRKIFLRIKRYIWQTF